MPASAARCSFSFPLVGEGRRGAVPVTLAPLSTLILPGLHLRTSARRFGKVDRKAVFGLDHHDPIFALRRRLGDVPFPHVRQYSFGIAFERVAKTAAARR